MCNLRRQQGVVSLDFLLCKLTVIKVKRSVTVTGELRVQGEPTETYGKEQWEEKQRLLITSNGGAVRHHPSNKEELTL